MSSSGGRWWRPALLAVACWAAAELCLSLGRLDGRVSPVWVPTGLATAGLLLWGRRLWPAVAVAALAVHLPLDHDLGVTVLVTAGSTAAPVLAATLLGAAGFRPELDRLRDALALVSLGALAMTVSATAGTLGLLVGGLPHAQAPQVWTTWFTGDAVGAVVVTPAVLCLHGALHRPWPAARRTAEWVLTMAATAAATVVGVTADHGMRFLVFPVLAVAAIRFQVRGAAPATLLTALVAGAAAARGAGVFDGVDDAQTMVVLALFDGCAAFTAFLSAGLTAERSQAHRALQRQSEELEGLVSARTQELRSARDRFRQLVEMAPDAMVFVDGDGTITQVNLQAEALFGHRRDQLLGRPLEVLIPERFHDVHRGHRGRFSAHPGMRPMGRDLELMARRRDGSEFPVEISLAPLDTDEGVLVCAAVRDVTDRKAQRDELAYRGLHDPLTGLPNRALLADRLARAVAGLSRAQGTVTALAFLDLDRFKWVNDSLGHDAGDALLRTVAARLAHAVRPDDTVARFGGDEFVVLSEGLTGREEAWALVDRLRSTVSAPVTLPEGQVVVPTVSIGLTTTDDPRADATALLRDADAAMYRAKEQGRDRTAVFAPEIRSELGVRLATAGGLRAAIEGGQLEVRYQPIVALDDGRPMAVEALVRWQHPERGLLLPEDFVALAEETGQIGALDRAVVLTACRQFGELLQAPGLSLNVNVSLRHLSVPHLRETLREGLAVGRLQPQQLTVEVTESANLSSDDFTALLLMVQDLGARVAIDDFGTGFSALSRLSGLAVDVIKVDRSFVTDVHTSPRGQSIVAAMTQLSTALGADVVAEGVEHRDQAATLRRLGCTGGQGFLWSRPVRAEELAHWLRTPRVPEPRRRRAAQPS